MLAVQEDLPMGLRMQPQNERFVTLFQRGRLERRRERGDTQDGTIP
ncbi:MAG: hypothetical protein ACRDRG_12960 [Pseudonocardiaceae bacterium]